MPILSQSVKTSKGASGKISSTVLTKSRFGGVPTRVPVPPILAEYAMHNIRAGAKLEISAPISFSRYNIAIPIGSIISVVELLDVHIDNIPVAIMKLSMIFGRLVPTALMVDNAIRLCKLLVSMALATKNAPNIRRTI